MLTSRNAPTDIESINAEAPQALRSISESLTNRYGPLGRSTIYHFGYPAGSDKLVRYTYRSGYDFEPKRFEGFEFGAKPTPPGFTLDAPQIRQDYIDLAERLREANTLLDEGVPFGGDLFATFVRNWDIGTQRWHTLASSR